MSLFGRLFGFARGNSLDSEIRAEMEYHVTLAARELEAAGVPPADALRQARLRFGSHALALEDTRRQDLIGWIDDSFRELRIAFRALRHSPSYSLVVVLALALGIGASTAVFSLVYAILFRALPYPDPGQLAFIFTKVANGRRSWANYEDLQDWKRDSKAFKSISAWVSQTANLTGAGEPDRLRAGFISDDFFSTLGVQPMGRAFLPEELVPNGPRVAIASWGLWQQKFGGSQSFLNSKINLNGEPYVIVGILPKEFNFPIDKLDVWLPYHTWPAYTPGRTHFNTAAIGRMRPGVSFAAAQEELDARVRALAVQYPETNKERTGARVIAFHEFIVEDLKPMLRVFAIAVLLAFLVACANIATLTVSRVLSRSRELGVRAALGAGRGRLLVHLFSEQLLLSAAGAILGLLLAYWFTRLAILSDYLPPMAAPRVDWPVALACLCLAAVAAIITGPLPAIPLLRGKDLDVSHGARGGSDTRAANRTRRALVTVSIAVSVVLLAGAGLLLRSFQALAGIDPGFKSDGLLTLEYRMPITKYPEKAMQSEFHQRVAAAAAQIPGVRSATVMMALPFSGNGNFDPFEIVGQTPAARGSEPRAQINRVDPSYFETMGILLLQGRTVQASDRLGTDQVVVVSKSMADRCWPGANPIGQRLIFRAFSPEPATVIGVVGDSKHSDLEEESRDKAYLAFSQHPHIFGTLAVRTAGDASALTRSVREAVWSVDKDQPVWKVRTMQTLIDSSMTGRRVLARLTGAFSLFALLLATIGLYGVISYATTRRARELSIRAAMGATRSGLVKLVLGQGVWNTAIGLLIGIACAIPASRLLGDLLFQVKATDPEPYLIAVSALGLAAILASLLPATRAASIDPARVLRQD